MMIREELNFTDFLFADTAPTLPVVSDDAGKADLVASGCQCTSCCAARLEDSAPPLNDNAPDLVPATIATTFSLAVGGSVDVSVDTLGDHDWYRVTLTAGQTYTFGTSSISGSNPDTFLNLRDAAGTVIVSDDDGGDNTYTTLSYTATTSGTFFIDAGTYADQSIGSYHLYAAANYTGADIAASAGTTATLAVGGAVNGSIEIASDRDWYAINLVAGQTYIFRTSGVTPSSDAAPGLDTLMNLRNAAGTVLLTNDDAGEHFFSAIRYTATTTGTHYIDVGAFSTGTGAFNLTAFTTPPLTVYSNDQIAQQLTEGYWGGASHRFNVAPGGTITFNTSGLTAAGVTLANAAFELWSDVTGIIFSSVATGGQIVLDDAQTGAFANAVYSGGITTSATINVGTQWLTDYGTGLNSYSFQTYIHEIGHTLGLGHGGNYNGNASYASDALYSNDSWVTTIMSYFDQNENSYFSGLGFTRQFTVTPMVADGVALTGLYGTNTLTRTGNTTYGFNNTSGRAVYDATVNPGVVYTVFDNGGTDTLDYSGFAQNQRINLNAELFSDIGGRVGNVSIARGSIIENAVGGSGNDAIFGNAIANTLTGGDGNDVIIGGLGADSLIGGNGRDVASYADDLGAVFVNLSSGLGYGNAAAGDSYLGIEDVLGSRFGDYIIGDDAGNQLDGRDGDDFLIGGLGGDMLIGGAGNDAASYEDNQGYVFINLSTGLGFGNSAAGDTFSGIESLVGGAYADVFIGDAGANVLDGRDGNDILIGGAGADALIGGNGSDTASYEDNQGYVFVNLSSGQAFGAAAGDTYSSIENLTGGAYGDVFIGSAGANILDGRDGNDTLIGGLGADILIGGNGIDTASYEDNQGAVTVNLLANTGTGNAAQGDTFSGVENVNGTAYADVLVGDNNANTLDGLAGNDTLTGNGGADIFRIGSGLDNITDFASGVDRIALSNASFAHTATLAVVAGAGAQVANSTNSTFLYNSTSGALSYDADGTGAGIAIQLAQLNPGLTLTVSDFIFY